MLKKGTAKLIASKDKIKVGSLVKNPSGLITNVKTFTKDRKILTGEDEVFEIKDCILYKYYIFARNGILLGELAYVDYDKVHDGCEVEGERTYRKAPVRKGDTVLISSVPIKRVDELLKEKERITILEGRIEDIVENKFIIKTSGNNIAVLRRNNFRIKGKNDNIEIFNCKNNGLQKSEDTRQQDKIY